MIGTTKMMTMDDYKNLLTSGSCIDRRMHLQPLKWRQKFVTTGSDSDPQTFLATSNSWMIDDLHTSIVAWEKFVGGDFSKTCITNEDGRANIKYEQAIMATSNKTYTTGISSSAKRRLTSRTWFISVDYQDTSTGKQHQLEHQWQL